MKRVQYFAFIFILLLLISVEPLSGIYQWTQKATFGGPARHRAVGIAIGERGYIGLGHINAVVDIYFKDWWEYDPSSNSWTQKADYGGGETNHAAAFSIGTKGYVGTGREYITFVNKNDFWEYDPVTNAWTRLSDFPGSPRRGAVGFSIGTKGYIGTGLSFSRTRDFYEYDPGTDTWTQKADFGGVGRDRAVGFSIGGKGYIGTGSTGWSEKDFWEYNPLTDSWIQQADVGFITRMEATGFSLNGKGFIGTGDNFSSGTNYGDMYEFDPSTGAWTQLEDFPGIKRRYMVAFTIGDRAYTGTGTNGTNFQDFWEFKVDASGTEDLPNQSFTVNVYPNPVTTAATISVKSQKLPVHNLSLELFDLNGKMVKRPDRVQGNGLTLHREGLAAGVYVFNLYQEGKMIHSGKISIR